MTEQEKYTEAIRRGYVEFAPGQWIRKRDLRHMEALYLPRETILRQAQGLDEIVNDVEIEKEVLSFPNPDDFAELGWRRIGENYYSKRVEDNTYYAKTTGFDLCISRGIDVIYDGSCTGPEILKIILLLLRIP